MPSGFQQDQNQLTPSYYRVVITMQGGSSTWYTVDSNEGDNTTGRISTYAWDNFEGENRPTTLDSARALARGNMRFQNIVTALENLADCQILDIEEDAVANGDAMADNNNIAFTVKFDRDEGVFPAYCAIRKQEDANYDGYTDPMDRDGVAYPKYYLYADNGGTANNTNDALRDVIWNTLNQTHSRSTRVFHPVEGSEPLEGEGAQEALTVESPFNNGQNAFNDITVQDVDGTSTTIITD
jgi:hypothetical protein